jgi:mono/diheme cytochrome c family protein
MPAFATILTDCQILAALAFIKARWRRQRSIRVSRVRWRAP